MRDVSQTIFFLLLVVSCWSVFLLKWPSKWRGIFGLALIALATPFLFLEVEAAIDRNLLFAIDLTLAALLMLYAVLGIVGVAPRGDRPDVRR
ncbi:MAG TPA: hypothetical protein VD887_01705 [Allosphingosinicella sp.]|nr:hypothetical protein [Allosphingosinicella sp.]